MKAETKFTVKQCTKCWISCRYRCLISLRQCLPNSILERLITLHLDETFSRVLLEYFDNSADSETRRDKRSMGIQVFDREITLTLCVQDIHPRLGGRK